MMLIAQNLKLTPEKISALLVGRTGLLLLGSTMSSLVEAMLAKAGVHSLLHERSFDILRGELKKETSVAHSNAAGDCSFTGTATTCRSTDIA